MGMTIVAFTVAFVSFPPSWPSSEQHTATEAFNPERLPGNALHVHQGTMHAMIAAHPNFLWGSTILAYIYFV